MQHKLKTLWDNTTEAKNCNIFRTPNIISQRKKNLFEPTTISIGPFHRGKKHLRDLEEQKWRFLQDFLSRGDHISLDLCISEMKSLEEITRRCYSEKFDDLKSKAFVEMMLLDGCFVLEYFIKDFEGNNLVPNSIYEVGWNSVFIFRDLLLLENQIPFFIVEKLYDIGNLNQVVDRMFFVKNFGYIFFSMGLTTDKEFMFSNPPAEIPDSIDYLYSIIPEPPAEIHHLVHLCYHYLVPIPEEPIVLRSKSFGLTNRIKGLLTRRFPHSTSRSLPVSLPNSTGNVSSMLIPCATELKQKGVKFSPKSNAKHMLDISFEYGVLKIPRLQITDDTKPIFANLLAFEHSKYGKKHSPFGRFVSFLDKLVNTPNDVTILQQCGIFENLLGSEEELTHFVNHLSEGNCVEQDHYLVGLYTEVNRYIGLRWNKHRAKFIRDYFSNPWTIISLFAAFILLVLTFVQSFFAVFAYFRPPKP
ncbi:UPF0481 protein At3g47200-like [Carex rostrata]